MAGFPASEEEVGKEVGKALGEVFAVREERCGRVGFVGTKDGVGSCYLSLCEGYCKRII
jgi:hypothetical protein